MQTSRFSPIMKLLSKFSYKQKFVVISLLFVLSSIFSLIFLIRLQNKEITFTKKEIAGTQYQVLIRKLFESIPGHQIVLTRYLSGETTLKPDLLQIETQITGEFRDLDNFDQNNEEILHTKVADFQFRESPNLKPREIEKHWTMLARDLNKQDNENLHAKYVQVIEELITLMHYIGDTSNLIADPQIETYYLVSIINDLLPNVQILVPQIINTADKIVSGKKPELNLKEKLLVYTTLVKYFVKETQRNIEKAAIGARISENNMQVNARLKDPLERFVESINELNSYIEKNILQQEKWTVNTGELKALGAKAIASSFTLWDVSSEQLILLLDQRLDSLKNEQFYNLILWSLCVLTAIIFGLLVLIEMSRPLENLINAAQKLERGDLSVRVPIIYKDEIGQVGQAFNQMAESFQDIIKQLQRSGIQLTTSTTEIAAAAKQQESTVVEQEATTKEIAVTASEISATAKEFAKTMNEISNNAEQTSALAASGKEGLAQLETIMRQMVEASTNIAAKLGVLNEKAGTITSVITTITKVADQTNLLSLNAAIEAEKAGEHGRSFSVIAREIRRLADQTANATLDIEKMVNEMVSAVSAGVMGVDKFTEEIRAGVSQSVAVSEQLSKIIEQVQVQTISFENVNQGMQNQSLGAEQINEAINQLSEVAQQTTESIRQFNNAIELLNNAAKEMQTSVAKIKK